MMSREELAAWLRLAATAGVGRSAARKLLAAFGSAEGVLAADRAALLEIADADTVHAIKRQDPHDQALLAATLRWLESAPAGAPRDLVTLADARYPPLLLQTADPPLALFTIGRVALLSAPCVAIVGSRRATPQGLDNARTFARQLSEQALTIVSGLATGVDGAAHEGGLAGCGSTIAFVGTGLDLVYPSQHAALARRIGEQGLVASEYPLGMEPLPINFPRRNRLIAGIAGGTLVVEAALKSGSLITARMALECGREVFAIPGSIHAPLSRGCHRLIQEGATLVETSADVLQELRVPHRGARLAPAQASLFTMAGDAGDDAGAASANPDHALLDALGHDPSTLDALAARTGLPIEQLAARVLELELAGVIQRLPGGLLQRRGMA